MKIIDSCRLAFIIMPLLQACNSVPESLPYDAYVHWIGDTTHGLVKERKINAVRVKGRFLPNSYLAYREWKANTMASYDSVVKSYGCGLTFQVQIQAEKSDREYGNLMYFNVRSQEDFGYRSRFLSFNIVDFIGLHYRGAKYDPVLTNFEGYDPLSNTLTFLVVFTIPDYACSEVKPDAENLTLNFNDPYWKLGTVNFEFDKNDLSHLPRLKI